MHIGSTQGESSMKGNVPIKVAASVMGVSELYVREAIAQNVLQIGCCITGKHGKRSFYISPKKFEELTGFIYEGRTDET